MRLQISAGRLRLLVLGLKEAGGPTNLVVTWRARWDASRRPESTDVWVLARPADGTYGTAQQMLNSMVRDISGVLEASDTSAA